LEAEKDRFGSTFFEVASAFTCGCFFDTLELFKLTPPAGTGTEELATVDFVFEEFASDNDDDTFISSITENNSCCILIADSTFSRWKKQTNKKTDYYTKKNYLTRFALVYHSAN